MATAATTPAGVTGPAWRFVFAGLMLAVMAWWIWLNHDPAQPLPAALVAVAAVVSVAWGAAQVIRQAQAPVDPSSIRASGLLSLGGSVALGGAALWLALLVGREALGEVLGLAYFSLLALATGC